MSPQDFNQPAWAVHLAQRFQRVLDFGSFTPLELPPGSGTIERIGPSWLPPLQETKDPRFAVETPSIVPDKKQLVTVSLLDGKGFTRGRFEGVVQARTRGQRGSILRVLFFNCLTADIALAYPDKDEVPGRMDISLDTNGTLVSDVMQGFHMLESLAPGVDAEFYIEGKKLGILRMGTDSAPWTPDEYTASLLADLALVQRNAPGLSFTVPQHLRVFQRVMLRVARLLLEGYATSLPPGIEIPMTLSGEYSDDVLRLVEDDGAMVCTIPDFPFDCQGSRVNLGQVTIYGRHVSAVNKEETLQVLNEGNFAGHTVTLRAVSPNSWWVYPGGIPRDDASMPGYRQWEIEGVEEFPAPREAGDDKATDPL